MVLIATAVTACCVRWGNGWLVEYSRVGQLFGTVYHPEEYERVKESLSKNDPVLWLRHGVLVVDSRRCPLAFCVPPLISGRKAQLEYSHFGFFVLFAVCVFVWVLRHTLKRKMGVTHDLSVFGRLIEDAAFGTQSMLLPSHGAHRVPGGLWLRTMVACTPFTELTFQWPPAQMTPYEVSGHQLSLCSLHNDDQVASCLLSVLAAVQLVMPAVFGRVF